MEYKLITGLHHITAMAADPQQNLNFYAGILGLRMVKKTINFDSPNVYHLYYGNNEGAPGTILTFFPIPGIRRGRKGPGQMTVTSFSVPSGSFDYWVNRFKRFQVKFNPLEERYNGERFIYFEDHDGLGLELVENDKDQTEPYIDGPVDSKNAIRSFHSATLHSERPADTQRLLTEQMHYQILDEDNSKIRLGLEGSNHGFVYLLKRPNREYTSVGGSGTIHHIAFATQNDETQLEIRDRLRRGGYQVTDVRDRQYFKSIYYREPGGILFEVATLPPGFLIDEDIKSLGTKLKLPPWEEKNRDEIKRGLAEISFDLAAFKD